MFLKKTMFLSIVLAMANTQLSQAQTLAYIDERHPSARFEITEQGLVKDLATDLIWQPCLLGTSGVECLDGEISEMTWVDALEAAQTSTAFGHDDWRLPNIKELQSIVSYNAIEPALNLEIFPNPGAEMVWSSTPIREFEQDSWLINFDTGLNWFKGRTSLYQVWLVREGISDEVLAEVDSQEGSGHVINDNLGTQEDSTLAVDRHLLEIVQSLELTGNPSAGRDLPSIDSPIAQLGKALFYSKRLSGEQDSACASCHHPMLGGGDGLSWPIGYDAVDIYHAGADNLLGDGRFFNGSEAQEIPGLPVVGRNAPSVFNIGIHDDGLFWDSRIESVSATEGKRGTEGGIITPDSTNYTTADSNIPAGASLANAQMRFPPVSSDEMRGDNPVGISYNGDNHSYRAAIAARFEGLTAWEQLFEAAYGDKTINFDKIAEAVAAFQESMVFTDSPWTNYVQSLNQDDVSALAVMSETQKNGAVLFYTNLETGGGNCNECHSGDTMTDGKLHAIGSAKVGPGVGHSTGNLSNTDLGRSEISGDDGDAYHYRTPSLLNIAVTGPYMHNGGIETLSQVMDVYGNPGGAINDLLGINTILDQTATFNNVGNAKFCELDQIESLMEKLNASCESVFNDLNPNAVRNTRNMFYRTFSESSNSAAEGIDLDTTQQNAVVEFMHALTDPCTQDTLCLADWVYDASTLPSHPDGHDASLVIIGVDKDGYPLAVD